MGRKALPFAKAYEFAERHGLAQEAARIEQLPNEPGFVEKPARMRRVRKGLLVRLFRAHNLLDAFRDLHWKEMTTDELAHLESWVQKYERIRPNDIPSLGQGGQTVTPPRGPAVEYVLPPLEKAAEHISLIKSLKEPQAERNHSGVVYDLLVRLGHDRSSLRYENGWIDVCVQNARRETVAVFEVKRDIARRAQRKKALRQANDYACQTAAPIFVITDADRYEVYHRRPVADYGAMFQGKFQLTQFQQSDINPASI